MAPKKTAADTTSDSPALSEQAAQAIGVEGVRIDEQPGDRTSQEKVEALSALADRAASLGPEDALKTLTELLADSGSPKVKAAAAQQIALLLQRSFNIDFVGVAPLEQVLSGEAGLRGALHPLGEHPHLVNDSVVPPGITKATGEILPPNIALHSDEHKQWAKDTGTPYQEPVAA